MAGVLHKQSIVQYLLFKICFSYCMRSGNLRQSLLAVRGAANELSRLALPTRCAGCGFIDEVLCGSCSEHIIARPRLFTRDIHGLEVWSGLDFAGVAAALIRKYKDEGRYDLRSALALPLLDSVVAALGAQVSASSAEMKMSDVPSPSCRYREEYLPGVNAAAVTNAQEHNNETGVLVCVPPSSPRSIRTRGYSPIESLLHQVGIRPTRAIKYTSDHTDQSGLSATDRHLNLQNSLQANRRAFEGREVIIVDDVLTTGATLAETRRAIVQAGGKVTGFACLAQTPLRNSGVLIEAN